MYITDILRRSSRNLKSSKARTLLTALAIGVGTFALTLTLAASNGATAFVDRIISENFDPAELLVAADKSVFGRADTTKPREYDPNFGTSTSNAGAAIPVKLLTDEDIAKFRARPDVDQVRKDVNLNLQYITRPGQKKFVGTLQSFSPSQNPDILAGTIPKPLGESQLLLPEAYIESLGFTNAKDAVGQKITLAVRRSPASIANSAQGEVFSVSDPAKLQQITETSNVEEQFTIAAVLKKPTTSQPGTELYIFAGEEDLTRLNDIATENTPNFRKYTFAYIRVKDGQDATKLQAVQEDLKSQGYDAQSVKDTQEFLNQIIGVLRGIVVAFGAISVIASVFGIINTMYISVLQRTREIGLMKALGMRNRDIGRLFRYEAAWIGFLGGVIGSILAIATGTLLNPWISDALDLDGQSLLIFKPNQVIVLILLLMLVSTLAGYLPSRKAAKLDPIEALRTE